MESNSSFRPDPAESHTSAAYLAGRIALSKAQNNLPVRAIKAVLASDQESLEWSRIQSFRARTWLIRYRWHFSWCWGWIVWFCSTCHPVDSSRCSEWRCWWACSCQRISHQTWGKCACKAASHGTRHQIRCCILVCRRMVWRFSPLIGLFPQAAHQRLKCSPGIKPIISPSFLLHKWSLHRLHLPQAHPWLEYP